MTDFTRFNRKAALLLAKLGEMGHKDSKKKLTDLGGITLSSVRYWRRADDEYKESKAISDRLQSLFGISDPRNLLSRDVTVKEFSAFLGYTNQQAREIIDQAYSELYPTYSIFYSNERASEDIVNRFRSFHLLYRLETGERVKQFTGEEANIVQMPLTVRYMLRGTRPSVSELFRVRCKLNIPSYTVNTPCFEYDGLITPQKYDTHYWLFENRSQENKDLLFMITDTPQIIRQHDQGVHLEQHYTQGIMLTRRQDAWPMHKIWKVVMLKYEPDSAPAQTSSSDPESAFMTTECKVVPDTDVPGWIVNTLASGWNSIDLSALPR